MKLLAPGNAPYLKFDEFPNTEHQLDAVVCALVARAAACNLTYRPSTAQMRKAQLEGWIHLPKRDTLPGLLGPAP